MVVYHYSPTRLHAIAPLRFQDSERAKKRMKELEDSAGESYFSTLSFFPFPVSPESVKRLQDAGFSQWGSVPLIEHKVDLSKEKDKIRFIELVATPEQNEFFYEHWAKMVKSEPGTPEFDAEKAEYLKLETARVRQIGQGPWRSVKEFSKSKGWKHFKSPSSEKWVDLNLEKGNKAQYATYIPHIIVTVTGPLEVVEQNVGMESNQPNWLEWK